MSHKCEDCSLFYSCLMPRGCSLESWYGYMDETAMMFFRNECINNKYNFYRKIPEDFLYNCNWLYAITSALLVIMLILILIILKGA